MKKWLTIALALAAALAVVGQFAITADTAGAQSSGTNPGWTGRVTINGYPEIDFAPTKPIGPSIYDDAIPRISVRFDDGTALTYNNNHPQAFLRRGIPVTLCINSETIGTDGFMTWEQIRKLQQFAQGNGTTLHIAQHTNNTMTGEDGDPSSITPASLKALTHEDIVWEFNTDTIYENTGYRPRVLIVPGNAGVIPFWRRNQEYLTSVLDSLGIWYTDINESAYDSLSYINYTPTVVQLDQFSSATESNYRNGTSFAYQKPGMGIQRWELISKTMDFGGIYVERSASTLAEDFEPTGSEGTNNYGYEFQTGVKPPRSDLFTLPDVGVDAAASGKYKRTWAAYYQGALAWNAGFQVVIHDSTKGISDVQTALSISTAAADGYFSPDHIAWTLAMLERKGHIKCVGIEEYAEWVTGDYAPNTDLINNPRCLIPQFDIGDTLGNTSEYAFVRGLGSIGVNYSVHEDGSFQIGNLEIEVGGNLAKFKRRTGATTADNPYYAIGDSVTGVRGRSGGIQMRADEANTSPERIFFGFGNLKPGGKYRFAIDAYYPNGGNPAIEEFHLGYKFKAFKLYDSATAGFATAYRDTAISWQWKDATLPLALDDAHDAAWNTIQIPVSLPHWPLGDGTAASNFGSSSEATDAGTRLFSPYSSTNKEGLITNGSWAWTMLWAANSNGVKFSNPRLVYLGQW